MAAEVLLASGFEVTVFDQMRSVGRKFLLAGRGGLNLTHSEPLDSFLDRYGPQRSRLEAAVRAFGPEDLRDWSETLGEPCFTGSSGRVFPESHRSTPLLRAWLTRLRDGGVSFATQHRWVGWREDFAALRFSSAEEPAVEVECDVTIFALGGASWPRSGSDGGWVETFRDVDVAVASLHPANGGLRIEWTQHFADRFAGVPLKNIAISAGGSPVRGDAMITATGIEGGPVYAHSASVRETVANGCGQIVIDLQPDLSLERLTDRLEGRRRPKDSLSTWLRRSGFDAVSISLLREVTANSVPIASRELAALAKTATLDVKSFMPIDRAISSAGGVLFKELDDSFMLHCMPGTFVVGEMLDWEAPTGGYLLQGCFSTAVTAARAAKQWVELKDC